MKNRTLHYYSGIIISIFVALHLSNHLASLWGAEKHIEVMNALRSFYRNIFIETILVAAVVVQVYSGITLFKQSRKQAKTFFNKLHIWSGLYLAMFLVVHVSAVFVGRWVLKLDTNFYFGAAGIITFPFNLFFVPYYALAIISFFAHLAAVRSKRIKIAIAGVSPHAQSLGILFFGISLTLLIFYGLTNHFSGVSIPDAYGVLVGKW